MASNKKRRLTKITLFRQKINRKKSIILALISKNQYECHYPDPDKCSKYDCYTGCCIDNHIQCGYRKKI